MQSLERAREYSRTKDRLALAGTALALAGSLAFVGTGLARWLAGLAIRSRRPGLRERLGFVATLAALSWLAGLPLGYISGYVVEHRFGLSRQSRLGWLGDQIKEQAIALTVALPLVEGFYWTLRRFPNRWWLVATAATVPVTAALAEIYPVLIAPRFNEFSPIDDPELESRLSDLAEKSGVEVAGVMQMDMSRRTSKANAFFAGLGRARRIVLSDTLLERFSLEEIEAVVAHEISHQQHRDIWRFIALNAGFSLLTMKLADSVLDWLLPRHGRRLVGTRDLADIRSLPAIGLVFGLAGLVLGPVQLAASRAIERRADAFALALTGDSRAFAGAMEKLAETNLTDPMPSRIIVLLRHSHPPIIERIAMAEAGEGGSRE